MIRDGKNLCVFILSEGWKWKDNPGGNKPPSRLLQETFPGKRDKVGTTEFIAKYGHDIMM
jgi:hypothetical protein